MHSNTGVRTALGAVRFVKYLGKSINAAKLVNAPELALAATTLIAPQNPKPA